MINQTIYALSTAWGKSGVAVIRVSGKNAQTLLSQMTSLEASSLKPRYAYLTKLFHPVSRETLDKVVVLFFKAPHSFTGEDCVEIQCHGSKAVIYYILEALSGLPDFRLAEPGEFSKRSFYNGKMDLTEAEGLADLIDAETAAQQKTAFCQMEGGLKKLYENWREELVTVLAYLEAFIDFPDENIPESKKESVLNTVFKLIKEIDEHLKTSKYGERLKEGFKVVIAGPANAGKSSLLNHLAGRRAAIVSNMAGTTRDALDIYTDIAGFPVIFTDTAGIRETSDKIEKKGVKITKEKIKKADLVLALFDATKPLPAMFAKKPDSKTILVANKADKLSFKRCSELEKKYILISIKSGYGMDTLSDLIATKVKKMFEAPASVPITRLRYKETLKECLQNLKNFHFNKEIELSTEDIRLAVRALGKITGRVEVDEILDKIFGAFCIGK